MPRRAATEDHARVYFAAAQEHWTLSYELHQTGRCVMSHYLAGLAVECLLRAHRYRTDPVFDSRHDMQPLYTASGLSAVLSAEEQKIIAVALTEVTRRWSNTHRYRSEKALRDYLRRAGLDRTGDFVKDSSRRIVNAAFTIVAIRVPKWNG